MKIYLAAMYSRRAEMEDIAIRLKRMGLKVTSRWVHGEEGTHEAVALFDLEDVDAADTVVSFTQPTGTFFNGGGRHVEFGYALAKGKRCIIIGERENVFHYHPKVEVYSSFTAWLEKEMEPV